MNGRFLQTVMPGPDPGIHVFRVSVARGGAYEKDADGRNRSGHDDNGIAVMSGAEWP